MKEQFPLTDPGLQPERTVMAWARTLVSFLVVCGVFLRWAPHYGTGVLVLVGIAACTAGGIYLSQRRRYSRMAHGVKNERIHADVAAVLVMTGAMLALGGSAIVLVAVGL
ncbi:DUF202 domain-containing protein [Glutamicibacter protophormiae]|uniref:DUF202 domain-containing protein n=1 Tax=Glutamicibacter protophormiae TaxID=37930 RepID=UPI002A81F0C9|nr:DUF202 domain-containing protein [Glutamicibacter protophormiae]WPR64149.1 DUF202 domain-containing protein [Glutamicibacter protophormiae]WPR67643.1 DUF202 domain-containing protein [Glutamicibacter protophormiae]